MNLDPSSLCPDLAQALRDGALLVDVRSRAECVGGMLAGAINLPLDELPAAVDQLQFDKTLLLYCRSGQRSEMARRYLTELGHPDCWNIGSYESFRGC